MVCATTTGYYKISQNQLFALTELAFATENIMTLMLENHRIDVSQARLSYNQLRLKYLVLASESADKFASTYYTRFKSIDQVHAHCPEIAYSYMRKAVEVALGDLVKLGIYDVDSDAFAAFLDPHFNWHEDFAEIDDAYMAIVQNTQEVDAYRTERRQSRGRWVGGGFGIEGAIKGAAKAGAMNMATNALHGGFNMAAKAVSAAGDALKKKALFENPATRESLIAALHRAVFGVHLALVDAANHNKPNTFSDLVDDEAQARAVRLLQNVESNRLPPETVHNVLLEVVHLDPYNEKFYRLWLDRFGDKKGDLERVEEFFGISVIRRVKQDLIAARKKTLDFSTPEACDKSLLLLQAYAESIGYLGFEKERASILAEKSARQRAQRTVDDVVYETDEQAAEARDRQARTVHGKTYATDAEADEARAQKVVGAGFYTLLLLFPYVTPFFTLRKGYSQHVRLISFVWMIGVGVVFFLNKHAESNGSPLISHAQSTAVSTSPGPGGKSPSVVAALPFVGKRTFNFDGGNGTEKSITISEDGHAHVETYGSAGTFVDFDGAFSNPLRMDKTGSLLFKGNSVFLMNGTEIQKGCKYAHLECADELYDDASESKKASLDLKAAMADPRAIVCRFNVIEQSCSDVDAPDGHSSSIEDFVISKGYKAVFRQQFFDEPGTSASYAKLTVNP